MNRYNAIFWAVLVVPHMLLLNFVSPYVDGTVVPDAPEHIARAIEVYEGNLALVLNFHESFILTSLLAMFMWLPNPVYLFILLQHVLSVVVAWLIFRMAEAIFVDRRVAYAASMIFSVSGMSLAFSHTILAGFWAMFFLALCMYCLIFSYRRPERRRILLVLGGVAFLLASLSKISVVGFIGVVPVIFLLQYKFSKACIENLSIFLIPYLLLFVPIVVLNLRHRDTLWGGEKDWEKNHLNSFFFNTVHFIDFSRESYPDVRETIRTDVDRCEKGNGIFCVGLMNTHWHLMDEVFDLLEKRYHIKDPLEQHQVLNQLAFEGILHNPLGYTLKISWEVVRFSLSWYSYITVVNLSPKTKQPFTQLWKDREYLPLIVRTVLYYFSPIYYMQFFCVFILISLVNLRKSKFVLMPAVPVFWIPIIYFMAVAVFMRWGIDRLRFPAEPYIYVFASHGLMVALDGITNFLNRWVRLSSFRKRHKTLNMNLIAGSLLGLLYMIFYPIQRILLKITSI